MGTCYTAILFDEFNWGYANTSKAQKMLEIDKVLAERKRGGFVIIADNVIYFTDMNIGNLITLK